MTALTLFDKVWNAHVVMRKDDGRTLLFADRHIMHDGSFMAYGRLRAKALPVAHPELTLATPDHYVPTTARTIDVVKDASALRILQDYTRNMADHGVHALAMGDGREGIVHVVGPEQGFTLPGTLLVCGDSHTSTHGALGALSFGIGASEVAHVLATQTVWQLRPRTMRIRVDGVLGAGVTAKDLALHIIATLGTSGATGHVVEYAGTAIEALSIEQRCTLCNMTIEAGAKSGMVAPDEVTFEYVKGRPLAPRGALWDQAVAHWRTLRTDEGAVFDTEVSLDAAEVSPMVTWGTSPEHAVAVTGRVPDPAASGAQREQAGRAAALDYMGLAAGQRIDSIAIDQVFIGSCTNSRLEDLRAAAAIVRRFGGRARVLTLVSPGSAEVKRAAEAEGLDGVFKAAGFEWREPGCSMCVGMNGDLVDAGKRCASTSNRNFAGRQGRDARTHLVSPATAAATAMLGHLADARDYL
ncbi:3-isopropylmalate dehydratase large subunit [Ramlibacter sp.]|uniref:3-isopropylmalate dehydratase large subunit n=1 Tax=Ramlibacter sp. TaxID=1917967 RepID=UPI003D0FFD48